MNTKGFGAEELVDTIATIRDLVGEVDDGSQWQELLDKCGWIQFLVYHYRAERKKAHELGYQLLEKARDMGGQEKSHDSAVPSGAINPVGRGCNARHGPV